MAVNVSEVLNLAQRLLIEDVNGGASWTSGLWTTAEVMRDLNEELRRFLLLSACIIERDTSIVTHAYTPNYTLPSAVLSITSVAFNEPTGSTYYALSRADRLQGDLMDQLWTVSAGTPMEYTTGELPSLTVGIIPPPDVPGSLELLYVPRPSDLTQSPDVAIPLPDELAEGLTFGLVSTMLGAQIGGSESPERALYARMRAEEYLAATKLMLMGWA